VPNVEIKMHKGTRALMTIYGWSVAGFMPPASGTYDLTQVSSIDDMENGDDAVNQVESADSIDEEPDLIIQINEENKIESLKNDNKQAVVDTPRDRASTSSDDRTRATRGDQSLNSNVAHGIRRSPRLAKLKKAACSLLMIFALIMSGNTSSAMLKETKVQQLTPGLHVIDSGDLWIEEMQIPFTINTKINITEDLLQLHQQNVNMAQCMAEFCKSQEGILKNTAPYKAHQQKSILKTPEDSSQSMRA
jgi:hypothetical protein